MDEDQKQKEAALALIKSEADAAVKSGLKSTEEAIQAIKSQMDEIGLAVKSSESKSLEMIQGLKAEQESREKKDKGFSWLKALRGQKTGNWNDAGFEKEIHEEIQKANATSPDSAGGYIVPTELWMSEFVEILKSKTIIDAAGVRRVSLAGRGDMEIPNQSGVITAAWLGENTAISETDVSFGTPVVLKPKTLAGATRYSKKVLNQTGGDIDRIIKQDLFSQMVLKLESDVFYGTGVSPVPLGLKNTSGLSGGTLLTGQTNGTAITYDILLDLIGAVEDVNVNVKGAKFVSSPAFIRTLKKLKDSTGKPLFDPTVSNDPLSYYLGYEALTTTLINSTVTKGTATSKTGEIFFGDFSNILLGIWQGLTIEASDVAGTAFLQNQVIIKATGEYDLANRRPAAFSMIPDAIVR